LSIFLCVFPVNYRQGQLATLIISGKWDSAGIEKARIALSSDGRVVAIGASTSIYLYSAINAEQVAHIPDAHNGTNFRIFRNFSFLIC